MHSIETIDNYIELAQISQFLSEAESAKMKALGGGSNKNDERIPLLLYRAWNVVAWGKLFFVGTEMLDAAANYMYALCGQYILKARGLLGTADGIIVNPVTGVNSTIGAIYEQFTIGVNSPINAGATSYTLNYTSIIRNSVSVEMPQDNIPQGETNQFSYTIIYNLTNAIINFKNLDESGTNIGVQNGMLFIIRGLRFGTTATTSPTLTNLPTLKIYGDEITMTADGPVYDNTAYAGQDLLLYYNGIGYVDITVKPTGGFIITSMPGPFTHADVFIMTPNGPI